MNVTVALTQAEQDVLADRIWAAIEAQDPSYGDLMRTAIADGTAGIAYVWSDDGAVVTVSMRDVPLCDVRRADLTPVLN